MLKQTRNITLCLARKLLTALWRQDRSGRIEPVQSLARGLAVRSNDMVDEKGQADSPCNRYNSVLEIANERRARRYGPDLRGSGRVGVQCDHFALGDVNRPPSTFYTQQPFSG